jgi:hypothetical protein
MILGMSLGGLEMRFSNMKDGCLDDVLVVEALYSLGSILRCFGWSFHS